jgi:DNA mismatch endonuclease (patch repair protein)
VVSKNTLPERRIQEALLVRGIGFQTHVSGIFGTPDIVIEDSKVVVFVHGCYWHKHSKCSAPSKHSSKIPLLHLVRNAAIARDVKIVRELKAEGHAVFIAWVCHIAQSAPTVVEKIIRLHNKTISLNES